MSDNPYIRIAEMFDELKRLDQLIETLEADNEEADQS